MGIAPLDAPLGTAENPPSHTDGQGGQAAVYRLHLGQGAPDAHEGKDGAHPVHRQQSQQHPHQNTGQQGRQQPVQGEKQRADPLHGNQAQKAPHRRGGEANIPIQVEAAGAVIPPAGMGGPLQQVARRPLHHSGAHGAAQEEEKPAAPQLAQAPGKYGPCQAIGKAQGTKQHAAVYIPLLPQGGEGGLQHPAQQAIAEKEPQQRKQRHFGIHLSVVMGLDGILPEIF